MNPSVKPSQPDRRDLFSVPTVVLLFILILLPVACGGPEPDRDRPEQGPPVYGEGDIQLSAQWKGEEPAASPVDVSSHEDECGTLSVPDESLVINPNGTVKNVVVTVTSGPDGFWRNRTEPVEIDQVECLYYPRVVVLQTEQELHVSDSDPGLHNVRATRDQRQVFNYSTYQNQGFTETFDDPGIYQLHCDVHPWMEAWVVVTWHGQAAVTGEHGEAVLSELPPGKYELETWHEEFGTENHTVDLTEGETLSLELSFPAHTTVNH